MNRTTLVLILCVLVAAMATLVGCGEKEVPFIVDADELIRNVSESEIARELFRTTGFINTDPYRFGFDSGLMRDSLIGSERSIVIRQLTPHDAETFPDYGGVIGQVREASLVVSDALTIQVSRTYSDTVLYDTTSVTLQRTGLFLKLGGDSRPWAGWVLYGFDGIGGSSLPLAVELESSSGTQFRGDLGLYRDENSWQRYIKLTEIDTVIQGSRLFIHTRKASNIRPTFQLISDYDPDGPFTRALHRYSDSEFTDSLSYETVNSNPRFYNLVFIQYLSDSTFPNRGAFVVPYRW